MEKIRAYELQDGFMSLLCVSTGDSECDSLDSMHYTFFKHIIAWSSDVRREVWTQCLGCSSDFFLFFLIPQCPWIVH